MLALHRVVSEAESELDPVTILPLQMEELLAQDLLVKPPPVTVLKLVSLSLFDHHIIKKMSKFVLIVKIEYVFDNFRKFSLMHVR